MLGVSATHRRTLVTRVVQEVNLLRSGLTSMVGSTINMEILSIECNLRPWIELGEIIEMLGF
jgi:hypothetical protein